MNRIEQIYQILLNEYGRQGWWPLINDKTLVCEYHKNAPKNESESFEIAMGSILTQNTQWRPNTVRAIQQLKLGRKFTKKELELINNSETNNYFTKLKKNNLLKKDKLKKLNLKSLSELIKPSGYFNQKAKKIKEFLNFNKEITRNNLLDIWGIGPETADSILLYAYKKPEFVIDAYTRRIMERVGFKFNDYDELKKIFMENINPDYNLFKEYHALLVEHAKRYCRKTPECQKCPLNNLCEYESKTT